MENCSQHANISTCFKQLLESRIIRNRNRAFGNESVNCTFNCEEQLSREKYTNDVLLNSLKYRANSHEANINLKTISLVLNSWEEVLYNRLKQEFSNFWKDVGKLNTSEDANSTEVAERKMKKKMPNVLPFLVTPGLVMAGILPWVLPQIKMLVFIVGMMNQVAFSMSFFSLVRRYIFEGNNAEHTFYVNHGYQNEHTQHGNHRHRR